MLIRSLVNYRLTVLGYGALVHRTFVQQSYAAADFITQSNSLYTHRTASSSHKGSIAAALSFPGPNLAFEASCVPELIISTCIVPKIYPVHKRVEPLLQDLKPVAVTVVYVWLVVQQARESDMGKS